MIYLDHNAITPVRPEAIAAVRAALERVREPGSVHAAGRAARDLLDCARAGSRGDRRAPGRRRVHLRRDRVGGARHPRRARGGAAGRRRLVVTSVEHPCVLSLARALEAAGTPLTVVPVDRRGLVDPEAFRAALGPDVALACAMRANNETGVLLPVPALAAAAREAGAPFFCDAVQAVGKIDVDVRTLGADLVALTGQKFGGPRGAGALWVTPGLRARAALRAASRSADAAPAPRTCPASPGSPPRSRPRSRARPEEAPRVGALRDRLEAGLLAAVPGARVNGAGARGCPGPPPSSFEGCDAEALLMALDLEGLCASAGSACHSGSTPPSGVLLALGLSEAEARATLRFSLGWTTTAAEVDAALRIVPPLVERVRRPGQARCPPVGDSHRSWCA